MFGQEQQGQYSIPEGIAYKSYNSLNMMGHVMALNPILLNTGEAIFNRFSPDRVISMQGSNALAWFRFAVGSTIAYRIFLEENEIDYRDIRTPQDLFEKVPVTSKALYVQRFGLADRIARKPNGEPYLP